MAQFFLRRRSSIKKEFTEEELKDLRTAFELLDLNQDGSVSTHEFKQMLNKLGINLDDDKISQIIRTASHTGKEMIDENDFLSFVKQIQEYWPEICQKSPADDLNDIQNDLLAAFKVFDLDNNGYITRDEMRTAMKMIGEAVTEEQLTQFITMADTDKDGRINYEEFLQLLS